MWTLANVRHPVPPRLVPDPFQLAVVKSTLGKGRYLGRADDGQNKM
jgi:hypothetical protein